MVGHSHPLLDFNPVTRKAAIGAMPDVCECGRDGVGRTDVNPVLGREVVEGKQRLPILRQAFDRLGILRLEGGNELLEVHEALCALPQHRAQQFLSLRWLAKLNYRILLHGWRDSLWWSAENELAIAFQ